MKIIIIGAGIGGLTTYHALRKHLSHPSPSFPKVTIAVYESHTSPTSTTSNIGGTLGLAPNGLRAIASVSQIAVDYIQEHGFPGSIFTFRNSRGNLLGHHFSGRPERYGFGMQMIRRAEVHLALLQDIPPGVITYGKKVTSVSETAEGVRVECDDGSSDDADLVIGADGVRSVVRQSIFQNQYPAEYDGLIGVAGFLPLSSLPSRLQEALQTKEYMTLTFGRLGLFGYFICSPKTNDPSDTYIQWWSVYESPTPPPRDQLLVDAFRSDLRDQLLKRHASWKSPYDSPDGRKVFESIISLGCGKPGTGSQSDDGGSPNETLLVQPQYVTRRIPQWSTPSGSGRVILLGDAAHAMPPASGQGVSSAAEDAVVLGLLLREFWDRGQSRGEGLRVDVDEAIRQTARSYEDIRMKRVWKILDITEKLGKGQMDVGWWKERIRDWFFWIACKLPESVNDKLFGYDAEVAVREYLAKGGFTPPSTL